MKITYDLEHLPERWNGAKESEEVAAIKVFMAGQQKNMFEAQFSPDKYALMQKYFPSALTEFENLLNGVI